MSTEDTSRTETTDSSQPGDGVSTKKSRAECVWLSPPQVAERLGVKADKVRNWIRTGELRASDFAEKLGGRPRYKVHETALIAFEQRREVKPQTPTVRRKRKQPDKIIEFF